MPGSAYCTGALQAVLTALGAWGKNGDGQGSVPAAAETLQRVVSGPLGLCKVKGGTLGQKLHSQLSLDRAIEE